MMISIVEGMMIIEGTAIETMTGAGEIGMIIGIDGMVTDVGTVGIGTSTEAVGMIISDMFFQKSLYSFV